MFTKLLVGAVTAGTMSVPLAGVAWADVSVSVAGVTAFDDGGPSTALTLGPNIAIAANNSYAATGGIGNLAIATNNSSAGAGGFLNTAIADNNSDAVAGFATSTGNTSIARDGSTARVESGSFNRVTAANNSYATSRSGSFNTVTASDSSTADIDGDANTVTARCGGSVTFSAQSNQIITSAPCAAG